MKKVLIALAIMSFLFLPVIGIGQMIFTKADCCVTHDLSDYEACCWDLPGFTQKCLNGVTADPLIRASCIDWWHNKFKTAGISKDLTACCFIDKILTIGDWLFTAILVVAIIIILIAAFQFLTSSGDPDKIKSARNYLIYALIGVAVAFLAKVLVRVVASIMT